ncbi:hypothetical protein ACFYT3_14445 [Nocardia amikacinitolerans]|uniref:hypothetical protein n=1 Tax=Nocardia amikacinitolerans TaxID=756689 RepID=UPI003692CEED
MFAEVDDAEWESEDTSIPELLREVASADDSERAHALRELEARLRPDGKIYRDKFGYGYDYDFHDNRPPVDRIHAARLAVLCTPFLLELAARPCGQDPPRILRLIAVMAGVDEDEEQRFRLCRACLRALDEIFAA